MTEETRRLIDDCSESESHLDEENDSSRGRVRFCRLLTVKLHFFTFFAGWGCLLPYLTLYYRYVGLSARQNGVVQSVRPFVNFAATPLWGVVGERFGGVKLIWVVSLLLQIVLTWLIALVRPDTDRGNLERVCYCGNQSNLSEWLTSTSDGHSQIQFSFLQRSRNTTQLCRELRRDALDARNIKLLEIAGLVAVGEAFAAPGPPLSDYYTLEILGSRRHGDYGKQRVWGTVGWGLASFAVGFVSDELGSSLCSPDYSLYFYLFGGLTALSVLFAILMGMGHKSGHNLSQTSEPSLPNQLNQPQVNFWFKLRLLLKNPRVVLFLVAAWLIGMLMSVIESFLFWFIQDLGGGKTIMGLSVLVMSLGEIPAFVLSDCLISRIGYTGVLCLTFVCYAVRFVAYSFITIPWTVLPVELLHGVTFALRSAALVLYARAVAPSGLEASAQTLFEGVLTGLGGGCGAILGGLCWQHLGSRMTFRISAWVSIAGLVLFCVGHAIISACCGEKYPNRKESLLPW
ncbi:major facilitator superfamily domain-containing protein 6-like [Corticium candelabrum]|uniref:major facilitator superfamily domain-containing protein 6-like n=1 Tax=Corticium candelabrum TaxID=121492 RepID=UPI002E2589ED|nr:major facilitator superfamily domain-containing protein 6-like [Corticium candelabrum]